MLQLHEHVLADVRRAAGDAERVAELRSRGRWRTRIGACVRRRHSAAGVDRAAPVRQDGPRWRLPTSAQADVDPGARPRPGLPGRRGRAGVPALARAGAGAAVRPAAGPGLDLLPADALDVGRHPPASSPLYSALARYLLPASLVLMLLSAELRSIARLGRAALVVMVAGVVGIMLGALLGYSLLRPWLPAGGLEGGGRAHRDLDRRQRQPGRGRHDAGPVARAAGRHHHRGHRGRLFLDGRADLAGRPPGARSTAGSAPTARRWRGWARAWLSGPRRRAGRWACPR